ncbi:MAG TPA: methyltransferase [Candidatus Coprenecus stercoravium]|uniref:tRNA1(Val) (adenine(37)-N6)-methyltransferase n=1 Tax=Candidatus Coprenecus stercoravium TaxID=2840735 RepID=A0A9D2GQ31_9BACT|nr:methyltransferase [Candidatus Coprenecus stercoravium]
MGSPDFRFRQFTVRHDRCAMKVGTDGVLLGAWAGHGSPGTILDIGTGSGLIALMLAQRFPEARITAIDCDADAAGQARDNFHASLWNDRLTAVHESLQEFSAHTAGRTGFDLIVSNPPFYDNTLTNPDSRRCTARHTGGLRHDELLPLSAGLLSDSGVFSLIIPSESEKSILRLADRCSLHPLRITKVYSKPGSKVRRVLATFGKSPVSAPEEDILVLMDEDGHRSAEHSALTAGFYL